jgi:hypothetical protein
MARNDKDGTDSPAENARNLPRLDQIAEDAPLRLNIAAALAYPDGSMTVSGLRREAARGRLVVERTAGKDYTTLGALLLERYGHHHPDHLSGARKSFSKHRDAVAEAVAGTR